MALAHLKLGEGSRRVEDEEDIAVAALNDFFEGARKNRFPKLKDRDSLWPLLATIATRKAINLRSKQQVAKRGSGKVRGESVFRDADGDWAGLDQVASAEISPDFLTDLNERCRELLNGLNDEALVLVAKRKLEGFPMRKSHKK